MCIYYTIYIYMYMIYIYMIYMYMHPLVFTLEDSLQSVGGTEKATPKPNMET